ncbi:MAG TPA: anthranilate phosphoribosyltransferase, partial [Chloroflexota bacterium]|nr:anthranilate phosphoribosyltransferase [Chloroflexota bacterium]
MIRDAIEKAVAGTDLTRDEAAAVMEEIMTGQATPAQFGALVTALRLKGETVPEIAGFASVMRRLATAVDAGRPVVDTCGTGGDGSGTFNISTTAAFVAAGAGATVAKHGNRSMTSKCGSADVLEALGVNISLNAAQVKTCLEE